MPRQVIQQAELRSRRRRQLTAHLQLHRAGVDDDLLEADDRGCGRALKTPQDRLHARDQLAHGKGLGDVVVGAQFQAKHTIVLSGPGRHEDDRDAAEPRVSPQLSADLQAVPPGNHDVQQEECGGLAFGVRNQIGRRGKGAYRVARAFQLMLHQARDIGIVFENENGLAQEPSLQ